MPAADAGVELVFVTGRPPRLLHPLRERLGYTRSATLLQMRRGAGTSRRTDSVSARAPRALIGCVREACRIIRQLRPAALFAAEPHRL